MKVKGLDGPHRGVVEGLPRLKVDARKASNVGFHVKIDENTTEFA